MAQLVARLVRNEKVGGSNPPSSTTGRHPIRMSVFCMHGCVVALSCRLWCRWCSGRSVPLLCGARPLCVPVGGGPPARSPHASLMARSGRSRGPPWPCRHPPAPRPGPPVPFIPAAPARCVVSTSGQAPQASQRPPIGRGVCMLPAQALSPPTGAAGWPSGRSGTLHTCGPGRWRVLGALSRSPAALLSLAVTHVKPSTPLLACALSPVKPTTPLQARYTHFWCYFIAQRRRGFHTGVLRFPHWC